MKKNLYYVVALSLLIALFWLVTRNRPAPNQGFKRVSDELLVKFSHAGVELHSGRNQWLLDWRAVLNGYELSHTQPRQRSIPSDDEIDS